MFSNGSLMNIFSLLLDIIGHIVEKDPVKETEKNGKKMRLIDTTLEDAE
jgi:hypothetical protein